MEWSWMRCPGCRLEALARLHPKKETYGRYKFCPNCGRRLSADDVKIVQGRALDTMIMGLAELFVEGVSEGGERPWFLRDKR